MLVFDDNIDHFADFHSVLNRGAGMICINSNINAAQVSLDTNMASNSIQAAAKGINIRLFAVLADVNNGKLRAVKVCQIIQVDTVIVLGCISPLPPLSTTLACLSTGSMSGVFSRMSSPALIMTSKSAS